MSGVIALAIGGLVSLGIVLLAVGIKAFADWMVGK